MQQTKRTAPAYLVTGVNGSGKSTLLANLAKEHHEFTVFSGSKALMDRLNIPQGDYRALQSLDDETKNRATNEMMHDTLNQVGENTKILLVDAHLFLVKPTTIIDCTGDWIERVKALFLIEADPEEIYQRITRDANSGARERLLWPVDSTEEERKERIAMSLEITREKAEHLTRKAEVPLIRIKNHGKSIETLKKEFLEAHNTLE